MAQIGFPVLKIVPVTFANLISVVYLPEVGEDVGEDKEPVEFPGMRRVLYTYELRFCRSKNMLHLLARSGQSRLSIANNLQWIVFNESSSSLGKSQGRHKRHKVVGER